MAHTRFFYALNTLLRTSVISREKYLENHATSLFN